MLLFLKSLILFQSITKLSNLSRVMKPDDNLCIVLRVSKHCKCFWYLENSYLHRVLRVRIVADVIKELAMKHEFMLHDHVNVEAIQVQDQLETVRRLKTTIQFE